MVRGPMGRVLLVGPDTDRVEQWLADAAATSDFVDARGFCSFAQLVEACEPARWLDRAPASTLAVRLLVAAQAPRLAASAWGPWASSVEFSVEVALLLAHLRSQAATPRKLRAAALAATGRLHQRASALASLWEAVDEALDAAGLVDPAALVQVAARRLQQEGLPPRLRGFEAIELRAVHDLGPARLELLEALAGACQRARARLEIHWPSSGEPKVDVFVLDALRAMEARWQALDVDVLPDSSEAPLAWVAPAALGDDGGSRPAPELSAFSAPSPTEEARHLAARVRALLDGGTPPERIAVASRGLSDDAESVLEAFDAVGVPARIRLGRPLHRTAVGRLALGVFEAIEEHFPADAVASLLEAPQVRHLPPGAARPRQAFLEAGVRDDELGATAEEGAYRVRLRELRQRTSDEAARRSLLELESSVAELLGLLRSLPERATGREHAEATWELLARLGLLRASPDQAPSRYGGSTTAPASSQPGSPSRTLHAVAGDRLARADAMDEAAREGLERLLEELKAALEVSGLAGRQMVRRDFGRHLAFAAASLQLPVYGPRAAAVWLLDVASLPGRRFEVLFLRGLTDGRFPGHAAPATVLDDGERRSVNRLAGAPLFRVGVADGDVWLPARLAEDRLLFHLALSSAQRVTMSRARFDASGKELLASLFLDAVVRVTGLHEATLPRVPVAGLDEVATERELRARAALELLCPPVTRQTPVDPRRAALAATLTEEEGWLEEARAMSAIERERLAFFSDPARPSSRFSGRIDAPLLERLGVELERGPEAPLSAAELGQWGQCAFRGLLANVLGLELPEAAPEEADGRTRGTFLHGLLAEVVPELARRGWLAKEELDAEAVAELVESAVRAIGDRLAQRYPTGHPALWELGRERGAATVRRAVQDSDVRLPFAGLGVVATEVPFGAPQAPPELRLVKLPAALEGERDVCLRGRLDRLDADAEQAAVIDYKSSGAAKRLRAEALLVSDFQLPVYLHAVAQWLPGRRLDAAWVELRDASVTRLSDVVDVAGGTLEGLLASDAATRERLAKEGLPNLANAVHALLGRLRQGEVGARPVDCRFCGFRSVCRISERRLTAEGA